MIIYWHYYKWFGKMCVNCISDTFSSHHWQFPCYHDSWPSAWLIHQFNLIDTLHSCGGNILMRVASNFIILNLHLYVIKKNLKSYAICNYLRDFEIGKTCTNNVFIFTHTSNQAIWFYWFANCIYFTNILNILFQLYLKASLLSWYNCWCI